MGRKRSVTFPRSTLADTTPESLRAQKGPAKAITTSASNDTQLVTEEQRIQAEWMLALAGVPVMAEEKDKRFEIEVVYAGGGYSGTIRSMPSLTKAVESVISSRTKIVVGRVKELRKNSDRGFQLLNGPRL